METIFKILSFQPLQIELPRLPIDQHITGKVTIQLPPNPFEPEANAKTHMAMMNGKIYIGANIPKTFHFTVPPAEKLVQPYTIILALETLLSKIDKYEKAYAPIHAALETQEQSSEE